MNTALTQPASRRVPAAGSVQKSWPWHLFAALIGSALAAMTVQQWFKPEVRVSIPTVAFRQGACRAEFQVSNRTRQPRQAVVRVTFGSLLPGEGDPSYRELSRVEISLMLTPGEQKNLTRDFLPLSPSFSLPTARAEVVSSR